MVTHPVPTPVAAHGWSCGFTSWGVYSPSAAPVLPMPPRARYLTVKAGPRGADLAGCGVDAEHGGSALLQDGVPQRRVVCVGVISISGICCHHASPCGHRSIPVGVSTGASLSPQLQPPRLDPPGSAPSTTCPVKTSCRKSGRLSFWSTTMISRSVGSSSVMPPRSSAKAFSCGCKVGGSGPSGRVEAARQHPYPKTVILLPVQHGVEEDLPAELVDGEDAQGLLIHSRPLDAVDHPPRLLLVRLNLPQEKQGWWSRSWGLSPTWGPHSALSLCPCHVPLLGCPHATPLTRVPHTLLAGEGGPCLPAPGGGGCACGSPRC